jgi:hypothetical protein
LSSETHPKTWHQKWISALNSENGIHFRFVQHSPANFAKSVSKWAIDYHESSKMVGETNRCSSACRLELEQNGSLENFQHLVMILCLIVRDGQRDGPLAMVYEVESLEETPLHRFHHAAALLLATVVLYLETDL